ncbi:MAG: hypothetical protein CBB99_07045 [Bacteroidetes bacterium TMED39]|nr:MAG: hypothetical protein CBB99_07045 [Bacteroidetes bacterium TMED39]
MYLYKMKKYFLMTALCALVSLSVQAKKVETNFKVYGQCGGCKDKIEAKLLDKKGITYAQWNVKTKDLKVVYNDKKMSEKDIHHIISELGYSTDQKKANPTCEKKLPKCCQPGGH